MTRVETTMWSKISFKAEDDARGFLAGRGGCDLTLVGPAQVQAATEETLLVGLFLGQPEVGGVIPEIADAEVLDANHPRGRNVLIVNAAADGLGAWLVLPSRGRCGGPR